jgi:predicted dithiol-disulfide oxidoreductase (DUF899 family)
MDAVVGHERLRNRDRERAQEARGGPKSPALGVEEASAFVLEDGVVYHTYSAYTRGMDVLWGMFQWLDRAPKGRNETGRWYRLHDEYASETA